MLEYHLQMGKRGPKKTRDYQVSLWLTPEEEALLIELVRLTGHSRAEIFRQGLTALRNATMMVLHAPAIAGDERAQAP
jgi:hypothetical protein